MDELHLPRVLRVRAGGRMLVLKKKAGESTAHVILKAIGYARYQPMYPDLRVEVPIGLRYKPDLVALDDEGGPRLWIECGHVDREKVQRLVRRYSRTHFVWLRRQAQWDGAVTMVQEAMMGVTRHAPIEILGVTDDILIAVIEYRDADHIAQSVTIATIPGIETDRVDARSSGR